MTKPKAETIRYRIMVEQSNGGLMCMGEGRDLESEATKLAVWYSNRHRGAYVQIWSTRRKYKQRGTLKDCLATAGKPL